MTIPSSSSTPNLPSHASPPLPTPNRPRPPSYITPSPLLPNDAECESQQTGAPPPQYSTLMTRVYPYSLRPILIVTSILGAIYAFVIAVNAVQNANQSWTTQKLYTLQMIIAIFSFIVGAIEVYGLGVGVLKSLKLAKALLYLAPLGVLLVFAGQVLTVTMHFVAKDDLISRCEHNLLNTTYFDSVGNISYITPAQASQSCYSSWNNGSWTVFAWLVVTTVLGLMFGSVAITYYRQLQDPSLIRRQGNFFGRQQPSDTYQMQSGTYAYPPPQREGWEVPPYPGPPAGGAENPFEKGEYHPSAEWAQAEPAGYNMSNNAHRAQEEAWSRAERDGPTAHLTAHASPPGRRQGDDSGDEAPLNGRRAAGNV